MFSDNDTIAAISTPIGRGAIGITRLSGPDALKLFEAGPDTFDLVLTDMTMPGMTGLELVKQLVDIRPGIPIILSTGFSTGITGEEIRPMGIRAMVMKPMIARELAETVRNALNPESE